jgi:hypothetical protein
MKPIMGNCWVQIYFRKAAVSSTRIMSTPLKILIVYASSFQNPHHSSHNLHFIRREVTTSEYHRYVDLTYELSNST